MRAGSAYVGRIAGEEKEEIMDVWLACGEICRSFSYRGLKPRIFFEWDVEGRATSVRGNPLFLSMPPKTRWRCHTIVEEMKAADIFS